jgi:DNA-binding response OmpR family regulator
MFLPSVLIFNEDVCFLSALTSTLQLAGYLVTPISQPGQVLVQVRQEAYDLLVLDTCPAGWGEDRFLGEVRRASAYIPIIALIDQPCLETAVQALRYKVCDYLEKSIPSQELVDRIQEVLRESRAGVDHSAILNQMQALLDTLRSVKSRPLERVEPAVSLPQEMPVPCFSRGGYSVNLTTREVAYADKQQIMLSPTEFNYWIALLRHEPEVISYKVLVKEAQSYDLGEREAMNLARWHIHGLRRIFEAEWGKSPIQTIRGVGYRVLL